MQKIRNKRLARLQAFQPPEGTINSSVSSKPIQPEVPRSNHTVQENLGSSQSSITATTSKKSSSSASTESKENLNITSSKPGLGPNTQGAWEDRTLSQIFQVTLTVGNLTCKLV